MTQTMTPTITYRRTKTGEWVVYGPAAIMHTGEATVRKADGTTKIERVERLGKSFLVDGRNMVYGYIGRVAAGHTSRTTDRRTRTCSSCYQPQGQCACRYQGDPRDWH